MAQEYCRSIARTAVAQLASQAGYERIQVPPANQPSPCSGTCTLTFCLKYRTDILPKQRNPVRLLYKA